MDTSTLLIGIAAVITAVSGLIGQFVGNARWKWVVRRLDRLDERVGLPPMPYAGEDDAE